MSLLFTQKNKEVFKFGSRLQCVESERANKLLSHFGTG